MSSAEGLYLDSLPKALLSAPKDPLAEAKEVLGRSGPLTPYLIPNER